MAQFHIHPWAKVGSLKNSTVMDLTAEMSNMKIENDLRREVQENIRRLKDMGTYRGRRHAMGLPVRGQRTRTQVSVRHGHKGFWMLIKTDCDCTKVEQDRKRRIWSGANVRGGSVYLCRTLYSIAWSGVNDLRTTSQPSNTKNFLFSPFLWFVKDQAVPSITEKVHYGYDDSCYQETPKREKPIRKDAREQTECLLSLLHLTQGSVRN